jgi:hypothetical protein
MSAPETRPPDRGLGAGSFPCFGACTMSGRIQGRTGLELRVRITVFAGLSAHLSEREVS